jgi:hypothetical protein
MLLQTLRLLERIDIAAMDPLGPDFVHTLVEALKLGFADREVFYGDPDAVDVPMETLLSAGYADTRAKLIGERASLELAPGDIGDARERMRQRARDGRQGETDRPRGGEPTFAPLPVEWGDTVHLDVVDAAGNMISATPSGGWLQGSPVVPGLGFPISTRGQMCWLEHGHPTTLRPRTRPRITLSPTLVTRDGKPFCDRYARRRSAGAVDPHGVPAPRASPHEPAAGDRRADVQTQAHGAVVPSASVRAGARDRRRPIPAATRAELERAAICSPSKVRGRSGAICAAAHGTASCAPPRRRG